MSLKDTLDWMGFEGEELKEARKAIMALRKEANSLI